MARHVGPQHAKSGYAAMGASLARPIHSGQDKSLSTAQIIARERNKAARAARIVKNYFFFTSGHGQRVEFYV